MIVTPDRYVLTAWRIPGRLDESPTVGWNKPCVMLQHGLFDNSRSWLVIDRQDNLAFQLAELGYDVWITNSRGNIESFEHLDPETHSVFSWGSDFWKFSFDHMAEYDVPSNIDYILKHTNQKKIHYVGHSQGTTQFFAANALNDDIADKIASFNAIGPVMEVTHQWAPIVTMLKNTHLEQVLIKLGFYNLLVIPNPVSIVLRSVVNKFKTTTWRIVEMMCGMSNDIHTNLALMPTFIRNEPGGTSVFNGKHWLDNMRKGGFYRYDYGTFEENQQKYG